MISLSTVIAIEHPENMLLLNDIRVTLQALSTRQEQTAPLLKAHARKKLWLNVENPGTDIWMWKSAYELVFDLRHDSIDGRYCDVRDFLLKYKSLLLKSGAREYQYADTRSTMRVNGLNHSDKVLSGYQKLREEGHLFDIQFVVDGTTIKAHKAILAAVVPHFFTVLTTGFRESQAFSQIHDSPTDDIPTYDMTLKVCAFAVRSSIGKPSRSDHPPQGWDADAFAPDYVYTGTFTSPPCTTTEG